MNLNTLLVLILYIQRRESLLMLADYVTADAGTGCVHTAPAFGEDDFNTGMRYKLPVYCNVDEQGSYDGILR